MEIVGCVILTLTLHQLFNGCSGSRHTLLPEAYSSRIAGRWLLDDRRVHVNLS